MAALFGRRPAVAAPGALSQRPPGDRRPVVLATLLAAAPEARERLLADIRRFPRLRFVVVTDDARIAPLLAAGAVAEHLPAPAAVRAGGMRGDWAAYLRRRRDRLLLKWEPAMRRDDGLDFDRYLGACGLDPSGSPPDARAA